MLGPNSYVWFGPWPRLNVSDPELIREILSKPVIYQKPLPEMGKILTGGHVVLEGEKWAKHRRIVSRAFHLDKLKVTLIVHNMYFLTPFYNEPFLFNWINQSVKIIKYVIIK